MCTGVTMEMPTTSSLGHIPGRSLIEVKTLVDSKSASRQPRPSKGRADGAATVAGGVARSLFNDRAFGALCSRPPRSIVALATLDRELLAPPLQRFSIARSLCKNLHDHQEVAMEVFLVQIHLLFWPCIKRQRNRHTGKLLYVKMCGRLRGGSVIAK